jgi:tRNA pseudouridine55 synthase
MNGIINILKPSGMTSHDAVAFIRKQLGVKKVGHTGTLDPGAIGVLPICVGKATKLADLITSQNKTYRAELKLGYRTDTGDAYGNIISKNEITLNKSQLISSIEKFIGDIEQIPPMYSAIKIKGQKLYELARKGIEVERKPRKIKIEYIKIIDIDTISNTAIIDVRCSKGTYIRTLCSDIGDDYGCGAYMSFLLRTSSGIFSIDDAVTLEEFKELSSNNKIRNIIRPIDTMFLHYPKIRVNEKDERLVLNGNKIIISNIEQGQKYRIYNKEDKFLCVSQAVKENKDVISLKIKKSFY